MIPPPLTRLQLARYLICAPLYMALLLLVAETLLSATTTYLVIKVARDIANKEFLVYDLFYILASQSTSYLVGAASWIFSEMAGCRAFGLYMLRFAQDNRHEVQLLNERNTRERVEPFLTGETFYEIFNMMYDVQSQLELFLGLPPDLLQFYLSDSGATVAIADAEFCARFDAVACKDTTLHTLIVVNGAAGEHAAPNAIAAERWLQGFPAELAEADTHRNEMAFWMYSSGSTGRPKGIVHLQHDMAYSDAAFARNFLKLTADDVCFSVPKMFFAYGFGNSITFPFSAGAATLLLPGQPKPAAIFDAIERFRPSVFFGLPTLYTSLTKAGGAAARDFSSLRMALSAAEVLSADVFNGWKTLTGIEIIEGLGSTEVLHIYLCNRPDRKKPGAAGLRVPGYEVALRDKDGRAVGDNEEGILWVRGDSNTPLYWNRPDKTAETIRDQGWIYTGDRFVRDADGFHFFRGRADDLIKISGQWVYPLEVELCLAEHPQVRECAVYAAELPDRRMTLKAVVVMSVSAFDENDATRMLQDFVKAKLLPYKYPREVRFIDELPKTGTGKIDRQALKRI